MMSFTSISGIQINNKIIRSSGRGDILYVGGSGTGNYTSIQDAIDNASDRDTVFVFDDSSPYYENIILNCYEKTGISVIGEDKNTTIIDGCGEKYVVDIYGFINYDMVFSDFTIKNGTHGIHLYFFNDNKLMQIKNNIITCNRGVGIWMDEVYGCTLSDNIIRENGYGGGVIVSGYFSDGCGNNKIINNIIENNGGGGIYLTYAYDNIISNNIIKNNTWDGIYCDSKEGIESNNIITQNIITNNFEGIFLSDFSNDTIVSENIISNNERNGINLWNNNNVTIEDNIISHNNISGIYIQQYVYNLSINHNIITDNGEIGIFVEFTSQNKIFNNNIAFHDYGLFLVHASLFDIVNNNIQNNEIVGLYLFYSKNNNISRNNFINNKGPNAVFYGTLFNCRNKWNGNYWGRPRLLPKIIFGRIGPNLNIPWFQFDWHPAKEPYEIGV
jgi:parallel beta-helix repeat protein